MATVIGERIAGKYEVLAEQGRGSFGEVYRAVQHPVDRVVAVKTLNPAHLGDPHNRLRFLREARALARITHPGIVTLHDFGEHAGRLYLVTEYVQGETLRTLIRRQAPFSVERTLLLAARILDALTAAHAAQVIHRDLKPANIMVYRDADEVEHVKLIDFGIASTVADPACPNEIVGTPRYMAPEQTLSSASELSDLYGLGAIMYEMLTGRPVFNGDAVLDVLRAHRHAHPQPMDPMLAVPLEVENLVLSALAKDPLARPASAEAMLAAVRACGSAAATTPPPAPAPSDAASSGAAIYLLPPLDVDNDDDEGDSPVNPLAATATHGVTGPMQPISASPAHAAAGPWVSVDPASGPLPTLVETQGAPSTPTETRRLETVFAECDPRPCWRRRCFWGLVGLNTVAFVLGAL